ncbi:flagellar hook-associated 2 domain protein [Desulfofarcimen acetoxidans DSM 771]|uniref:Flagellar hook-associated protein 2 n=1 Tax=Desulfofarcimen acetoxidans (strain ATCC 49208 / DSM 771 / KCTC 5769 / VKM B-1644 / 5575) TaxID=485916 RepID=C8W1D6_DESAS|nr:flagellar hook-associated protein 2 [Desulfofarcimen acetoxidans]ACV61581.1 flagellar hook-associated 2 domain protein [Desulfofarcimen acetoxidans DSM 771]
MSSSLRISGLASGMDIDSMVKQLMKAERMRLDTLTQKKQTLEWQQEDYRTVNSLLRSLRDATFNMKLQGTFLSRQATSNNESVVKVTTGTSAVDGTYEVSVSQLAKGAYLTGDKINSGNTANLKSQLNLTEGGEKTLVINGPNGTKKTITVDTDTAKMADLVAEINSGLDDSGNTWGVRASYDAVNDRLFLMTKDTGADQTIAVEEGELAQALKLTSGNFAYSSGQNANYKLNGVDLEAATNTVTINGLTLDIKGVSAKDSGGDPTPTTVTVSRNTDAVYNAIKEFVDKYNETIEKVNKEYYEDRYTDYRPLTDTMRESLSDDQEEKWEEKARSGMLRFDSLLGSSLSKFRSTLNSAVDNVSSTENYNNLTKIGITTGSYQDNGKLIISEKKLKEAIQKDPDGVMDLFTKSGDTYKEKGLAGRLYDDITNAMDSVIAKAGSSDSLVDDSVVGKQIKDVSNRITTMEDHLEDIEDRYYKKFSVMEEALSKLSQQSAWITQMLGGK